MQRRAEFAPGVAWSTLRAVRVTLLLSSLVALLAIGWWWSSALGPPPPPAPTGAPAAAVANDPASPSVASTGPDRTTATLPLGTIRGRVVDGERRPLGNALASLVHDGADAEGQQTTTGADGRFTLFRAPLAACAVRIDAAGFCAAQLGDLHPEQAAHHDLDLGDFVLQPAAFYTGLVQSGGRPLAGAQITLRPVLGEPGAPTPLVQRTTSGADGTFGFAQGVTPPSLLEVTAADHWPAPMRRIEAPQQLLVIELQARPRLRGRVVTAETGIGVAAAPLWLIPLDIEVEFLPATGDRGPVLHRTDRYGNFDVELPPSPWFAVESGGDDAVPTISGAIQNTLPLAPLELRLTRGIAVHGTVTWRGDPVAGSAALLSSTASGSSVAFGADGTFRLPAREPGAWTLRVDGDHGARHEQPVQLAWPGPLRVTIALGDGVRLSGKVNGPDTGWSKVVCKHQTGLLRHGLRQADGSYTIDGLSPGLWTAWVAVDGADWRSVAMDQLLARLPHPEFRIDAEADARLDLRHPDSLLGSLSGRVGLEFVDCQVTLRAGSELGIAVPPTLLQTEVHSDGTFVLDPVLPGDWHVELLRAGRPAALRRTRVQVAAGLRAECRFD